MELLKPKEYNEILKDFEKLSVEKRYALLRNIKKTDLLKQFIPKSGIKLYKFIYWRNAMDFWLVKEFTSTHIILENTFDKTQRNVQYRYLFSSFTPVYSKNIKKQIKDFESDINNLKNILNQIS
jgi:hypothetical protein